jgi:tetratricopeptide (TPR) repeat protein
VITQTGQIPLEDLRARAQRAIVAGQLAEAEAVLEAALLRAEESGDRREIDLAFCSRASLAIELGHGETYIKELREILLRNSDHESCFLAAYGIARAYDFSRAFKKALFYARIARDRAEILGRQEWLASAYNQIGNLLVVESFFEEACHEYEHALELAPADSEIRRALFKDNLGYCYIIQGRHAEGFRLLFESYRALRRLGAVRYSVGPRVSLCFAYLEVGRPERALLCGRPALETAQAEGQKEYVKNLLYLLGEAANLAGDVNLARSYFSRLQREFYPGAGYLPDFLLAIDVRKLINLKA